eukprot:TRINITY_DN34977_c0_g1_i1.p1 TRINITY_DN34977_c0_g1~~TRINITY_DN34977_c0_g1_i1.p1  ORF type:complete len:522 (-),score=98.29 TRINITY_DN34977_c0_g1_i1:163-1728(-)
MATEASGGGPSLKFGNVTCFGKPGRGVFKATTDQFGWESLDKAAPCSMSWSGQKIVSAAWQRTCWRGFGLIKFCLKGDPGTARFSGFRIEDQPALKSHLKKAFGVDMEEQPIAISGWSWGDWEMDENGSEFRVKMEGKIGIEVPSSEVVQVTALGKTDLNLEFQAECDPEEEVLHEMRLFFPGQGPETASAERVRDELSQYTGFSSKGAKDVITRISDISVTAPRGRHDFEFFQQVVKMHGKTQSYTVKYKSIARMFLLTMPTTEVAFVIGLDQPLRQGTQQQAFLVLTFDREREIPIDAPKEKLVALGLPQQTDQKECDFVPRLFKALSQKNVIAPSSEFAELLKKAVGQSGTAPCVRCSMKTQVGLLYPLRDSMLFVTKPVVWIRHRDVELVEFASTLMRRTSFDLRVHLKGQSVQEFTNLERKVYECMRQHFEARGVKIQANDDMRKKEGGDRSSRPGRRAAASAGANLSASAGDKDYNSEDDEDYNDEGSDADDGPSEDSSAEPSEDEAPKRKRARK